MTSEIPRWKTPSPVWNKVKTVARQMRANPTESENLLWEHLRARRLNGFRFRRQHSLGQFIVDFYCAESRLVVEVDGPIHQRRKEEDAIRDAFLEYRGLRVLRFTDTQVLHNLDEVLSDISKALTTPSPTSERGRGEVNPPSLKSERELEGEV